MATERSGKYQRDQVGDIIGQCLAMIASLDSSRDRELVISTINRRFDYQPVVAAWPDQEADDLT